jgi:anti-sigma factor RsiW
MRDNENHLRVQSYLDGELTAEERLQVEESLSRDSGSKGLLAELSMTRQALAGHEAGIRLPESREFYWSKIERGIKAAERAETIPSGRMASGGFWRRWLMPAGALATLALAAWLAGTQAGFIHSAGQHGESALADSGAFTYRDYTTGTTLVWLTYPAEN